MVTWCALSNTGYVATLELPATPMDNNYLWVSAVSVKHFPCSLQLQNVLRMLNSKELSHSYKLIQHWDVTISVINLGHKPGWHHTRCSNQGSFPPTSLLVLAFTCWHANCDTCLKTTKGFACQTHSKLNPLISCQCVFRVTTADLQHCRIQHIHSHICLPHTSLGSHSFVPTPTWLLMTQVAATIICTAIPLCNILQPTTPIIRITSSLCCTTTLSTSSPNYYLTSLPLEGKYCSGSCDLAISFQQTHHILTSCMH